MWACQGCVVSAATTPLLGGTLASRIAFVRLFPVESIALHWLVGVTFFLVTLSTLMQVRMRAPGRAGTTCPRELPQHLPYRAVCPPPPLPLQLGTRLHPALSLPFRDLTSLKTGFMKWVGAAFGHPT